VTPSPIARPTAALEPGEGADAIALGGVADSELGEHDADPDREDQDQIDDEKRGGNRRFLGIRRSTKLSACRRRSR
jgi:hypothetical protein